MSAPPKPTYSGRSFAAAPPLPGARTETTQAFGAAPALAVQVQGGRARGATASGTVPLARLTPGGTAGSLTFTSGLLTAFVPPT